MPTRLYLYASRRIPTSNTCLIICKEVGDRAGQGKSYGNLGNIYSLLGEYQRAIEYTKEYLIIAKEVGERALECNAYSSLGATYQMLNEFRRAMECHEKHPSIAKEVGDRKKKDVLIYTSAEFIIPSATCHEQWSTTSNA